MADIGSDFLSVAYAPGQSVRVNSTFVAAYVQERLGKPAVFTLATRDMNRLGVQSLLLSASWGGLRNVVVVMGDPIRNRDRGRVTTVNDYTTTTLLSDIGKMNRGLDFRGFTLAGSTAFCAGATVDLSKGARRETSLAARKVRAGAEFFLSQTHFNANDLCVLRSHLSPAHGRQVPIFAGVQILEAEGIDFGNVPDEIRRDLTAGRSGLDVAKELALDLWLEGIATFYVIPTILRKGLRDYEAAAELVGYIRALPSSHPTCNR